MDGTCILKHGNNILRLPEGKHACDIFSRMPALWMSVAHNINKSISRCQQGGALVAAFGRLVMFVQETAINRTGLGHWSWIRVGTGDHSTRIISAYQPCNLTKTRTSTLDPSGKMKRSQTVWAQHVQYLRKRGIFHDPRTAFCQQLITQLKHWQAKGDKITLCADFNENIYTGQLAWLLQGDNLLISEQMLQSTGSEAPFSHG